MNAGSSLTPDLSYGRAYDGTVERPSWSANPGYVNDEHRAIFGQTKDIPGWQAEGDTYKLYEMAHFAGDVILEIGIYGGRSAVVELRGALSNPARTKPPQFYGIDPDPEALDRSYETLRKFGLLDYAVLYRGTITQFFDEFAVRPTMVFVDADHEYAGVKQDLDTLSRTLCANVPVLCHDYFNPENETGEYGVRRAVTEWEESGHATFRGGFGCSAFLVTTDRCPGLVRMADADFAERRDALYAEYGLPAVGPAVAGGPSGVPNETWRDRAERLESQLRSLQASRSYRLARALAGGVGRVRGALRGRSTV